jgi:asparagine synthase (glutamine-hydrolysing)
MCGINGIFSYASSAPSVDRGELVVTRERMRARGPDAAGIWISPDGRAGLGHRRLAIIDLSPAGGQPMTNAGNAIVFNGEIYNYRELRRELEAGGVAFTSHSDTEVVLRLFERDGPVMLNKLRGMFAMAIWQGMTRRLFIARDPLGIKPLYYADDGATFRFASQVKALVAGGRVCRQFDPAGAASFFLRGTIAEPFTMYRAVRQLPAGSFAWIDEGGVHPPIHYFSIARTLRHAVRSSRLRPAGERDLVHDALLESVRYHLVSDVPVGMFLSAGIDSGAVIAAARECGAPSLDTVTLTFEEYRGRANDEAPLAGEVAKLYGYRHHVRELTAAEFAAEMPRFFEAMDQPTIDGINSYFVSKAAADLGLKVALSGAGGDELFGGYNSFRDIPRWMPFTPLLSRVPGAGAAVLRLNSALARVTRHVRPKMGEIVRFGSSYAGAYFVKRGRFLMSELPALLGAERAAEGLERLDILRLIEQTITPDPGTPFTRIAAMEASLYMRNQGLRDADWASMAHSVEVRLPLVDAHLLQKLAPVMARRRRPGKQMLADAPASPLPAAIRNRRKTGFTVPIKEWLAREGATDVGKRSWALKVYEVMFSSANGHW